MTGAELRALCVAVATARDAWDAVANKAPDRALAIDSPEWRAMLSAEGALHVALFRSTTNDAARTILAALDDAERVATERVMLGTAEWCDEMERISDKTGDFNKGASLTYGHVAGHCRTVARLVRRESAKGGE